MTVNMDAIVIGTDETMTPVPDLILITTTGMLMIAHHEAVVGAGTMALLPRQPLRLPSLRQQTQPG